MKEVKENDGTITAKLTYIWLYESDRFVHYPYCPYCGEKLGK